MKTPYVQMNYVVTASLYTSYGTSKVVTDCLSIDSKNYPKLLVSDKKENLAFIAICLRDEAKKWYNSDEVAIINFWYQDSDNAYLDEQGNITFD